MDYFKKFSLVQYDFTTVEDSKQIFTLSDISTRVKTFYDSSTTSELFDAYVIKDWDTPEKISYKLYGTTEYYWTILYVNNIFDLYNDWPLTSEEVLIYAKSLYPGVTSSPIDNFSVVCEYYAEGSFTITLPLKNEDSVVAINPERVLVGTFVDPIVAGEGCTVTAITKEEYINEGVHTFKIHLDIDKPTYRYPNNDPDEPVTFRNFSSSVEEFYGKSYYINPRGIIKDPDADYGVDRLSMVSKLDELIAANERKKRINIIKPSRIQNFVANYFSSLI